MAAASRDLSNRPLRATQFDQALFVDRQVEFDALLGAARTGLNALLIGDRGSGKTSLLQRLVAESRDATPADVEIVRVDAQLASSPARILLAVGEQLGIAPFPVPLLEHIGTQRLPSDEDNPAGLLDAIRRIGERGKVVVALDNVVSSAAFTLFGRLRDELWQQPPRWILAVDREQHRNIQRPPADAFFERTVHLAPFDGPTVRALLNVRGLSVSAGVSVEIANSARGNLRKVLAAAREITASPDVESAVERVSAKGRHRDVQLAALPPAARMLHETMLALDRPVSASDEELLTQLSWTRPRAVAVFRQLEDAGLVESGSEKSADKGPGRPRRTFRLVAP